MMEKGLKKEKISKEQEVYFANSVIRDSNGELIKMYHGTPFDDYNYFRGGTHFTQDRDYAKTYENAGASSSGINNKKLMNGAKLSPVTYEVYLNITKPFTLEDEECLRIYIDEYIKGGNAQGINPYLSDDEYKKMFANNPVIDWNEADNLKEFLEENEYGYDGLIVDEGGVGGYIEDVVNRGKSYVIFHPEQVKLTSDRMPVNTKEFKTETTEIKDKQEKLQENSSVRYKYYVTQRPIDIGTIPKANMAHITNFEDRKMVDEIGRQAYGYVEYEKPLSEQDIINYELFAPSYKTENMELDNSTLMNAGIRPIKGEECYVYIVRKKSNGQYHVAWTQNLSARLNELEDKDKILGGFIVPNKMTAFHFKNAINKMSHFNIETMLLYPDRLKDMYEGHNIVEYIDTSKLNEIAELDTKPLIRKFQFMHSENDIVNEIYNDSVTKLTSIVKERYLEDVKVSSDMMSQFADNILLERIDIIEKAVEKGFSKNEIEALMRINASSEDYMYYSLEQAQYIVENGANAIIEDKGKQLIPEGYFEDIVVDANTSVNYYKSGLNGRCFMQLTDNAKGKSTLYTLESFSVFPYVSQLVLDGYNGSDTKEIIERFVSLDERIEDDVLAENIVSFIKQTSGQSIEEERVVNMLKRGDSAGLYHLIENVKLSERIAEQDIDVTIKRNQLKGLIKHNAKAFDRKDIEQFIKSVKEDVRALENIPDYIGEDIESLRKITKEISGALKYLPDIAKKDLECVLNAVSKNGQDYLHVDEELKSNEDIIRNALINDKSVSFHISKENLQKVASKSKLSEKKVSDLSIEDCLAIYAYVEDDISLQPVSNYFEANADKKDAMFNSLEEKWNNEEETVIKEPKTAILKLKNTKENEAKRGFTLDELKEKGIKLDISDYEIVYIKEGVVKSKEDINNLFRDINGEEKPKDFYEDSMEIGDIVVTTNDGFNFDSYFVDMNNSKLDSDFLNPLTVRKINDNMDVRVERDLLERFKESNVLDETHAERLSSINRLYNEHFLSADKYEQDEVEEETKFELTQEEKDSLRGIDIAENRQNILPKDRMTYKKEDGEVILKKDAVKNKEEFVQRTAELNKREEVITNLSLTYAIESSEDFTEMLNEYPNEDIKQGINYRLVQIDKLSGKIVKVNELLFPSKEMAEQFFYEEINASNSGKGNNVLVNYDTLIQKSLEVASIRKDNELLKGIQNVMDSESFKGWCIARANQFHNKYSLNNSLSIFLQKPDSSIVYGARQWQEYGRQVKKGEKALRITVPSKTAYQKQNGGLMKVIAKSIQEQIDNGKEAGVYRLGDSNLTFIGNKTGLYSLLINDKVVLSNVDSKFLSNYIDTHIIGKTPVTFSSCNVFDISQVEEPEYLFIRNLKEEDKKDLVVDENGEPKRTRNGAYIVKNTKERIEKLNPVLDTHVEDSKEINVEEVYKTLQIISERNGVPVSEALTQEEMGAKGYYSRAESKIVIDSTLSPTEKVAVCVHEIAHSRMHKNGANLPVRLKEVQAETVSYIVNKSIGIDTETSSFNYIANWMGSRRMSEIKQSLDIINAESSALYEDIIKDLEERGVSLKLDEYIKENELSISEERGLTDTYLKNLSDISFETTQIICDLKKSIEVHSNLLNDEQDKNTASLRLNNLKLRQSALGECENIKRLVNELKGCNPQDTIGINQKKEILAKSLERLYVCNNEIKRVDNLIKDMENERLAKEETGMTNIERLRSDFDKDSIGALKALKENYAKIADLDENQIYYLSDSPFIKEGIKNVTDIKSFVDLCSIQAKNAEQVKSASNIFVEIVSSEYEDLQKGSLMHIKVADEIMSKVEYGVRNLREEALKYKGLIPCVTVELNIYGQNEKGNLMSLSGMKIDLGNKKQDGLLSAIENRTKDYHKYQNFMKDCKESCKEKKVEKEKNTPPVPNIMQIVERNNFFREHRDEKESRKKSDLKEVENYGVRDLNISHIGDKNITPDRNTKNNDDMVR